MKITGAKNNTTKGFLLCFRPFPMEEEASITDAAAATNSFSVIEKPTPPSSNVYSSDKESIIRNQKKTPRRRFLSKIVKAMAFKSSLSKKVRNGKINQDRNLKSRRRSSSSSSEDENGSSISSSILSSSSSSSLSTSSSSSIASSWSTSSDSNRSLGSFRSSYSIEDEKKQKIITHQSNTTDSKKKISGICLLLISLFVLIFWGKFFAILCTSTWFYFFSTARGDRDVGDNKRRMLIKLPVVSPSKEHKKKIIMEGFLERKNHRGCFHLH